MDACLIKDYVHDKNGPRGPEVFWTIQYVIMNEMYFGESCSLLSLHNCHQNEIFFDYLL